MISLKEIESKSINNDLISDFIFLKLLNLRVGDRLSSIYNGESVPSLFIYFDENYKSIRFKDFSSDNWGDGFKLLKDTTLLKPNLVKDERLKKGINSRSTYQHIKGLVYKLYYKEISEFSKVRDNEVKIKSNCDTVSTGLAFPTYDICENPLLYEYFKSYKVKEKDISKFNVLNLCCAIYKNYIMDDKLIIGYFNRSGGLIQAYVPKEYSKTGKKKFLTISSEPVVYYNIVNKSKPINIFVYGAIKDNITFSNYMFNNTHHNIVGVSILSEKKFEEEDIVDIVNKYLPVKDYKIFVMFDFDSIGIRKSEQIFEKETIYRANISMKPFIDENIKDISDMLKEYNDIDIDLIVKTTIKNHLI